jgi:hypothetical protein
MLAKMAIQPVINVAACVRRTDDLRNWRRERLHSRGLHAILKPPIERDYHRTVEDQRRVEGDPLRVPDTLHEDRCRRTTIAVSNRVHRSHISGYRRQRLDALHERRLDFHVGPNSGWPLRRFPPLLS